MHKSFLRAAALLGALAVALGAFGAHALRGKVPDVAVNTFETGVRYHFYHVLALCVLAIMYKEFTNKWITWAGNLFLVGILLFSGSLYTLTFILAAVRPGLSWIGIITPFGGLAFIAGWFCMLMGVLRTADK
ncbi:DUF423 domain-containing protein [Segetibacter sp. 3557_3]|uniref:DUF423 domain-containing protein n=1 Tax=Segetibacter sp. 3557_3 TaxID=2547429 RepID=UPI00105910A7|nr:DUF423 domain-containing protein [Segetibacter sp. 3557_3]TDH25678.1 DUF423 domain-containing protein [Segetibacter sp. 3557_3]